MISQLSNNYNYNAFTKVLLSRYNHNHGTHMYHCPLKQGSANSFWCDPKSICLEFTDPKI